MKKEFENCIYQNYVDQWVTRSVMVNLPASTDEGRKQNLPATTKEKKERNTKPRKEKKEQNTKKKGKENRGKKEEREWNLPSSANTKEKRKENKNKEIGKNQKEKREENLPIGQCIKKLVEKKRKKETTVKKENIKGGTTEEDNLPSKTYSLRTRTEVSYKANLDGSESEISEIDDDEKDVDFEVISTTEESLLSDVEPLSDYDNNNTEEFLASYVKMGKHSGKPQPPESLTTNFDWMNLLEEMQKCYSYATLESALKERWLPPLKTNYKNTVMANDKVDGLSTFLYPSDGPERKVPITTVGDGNCLFRSFSHLVFGTEERHIELRIRAIQEGIKNKNVYIDDEYLYKGSLRRHPTVTISDLYCMQTPSYENRLSKDRIYERDLVRIRQPRAWTGMFQIYQLSNVLKRVIRVVYPEVSQMIREDMNRFIYPIEMTDIDDTLDIMWTSSNNVTLNIDHFVPLMYRYK